MSLIKRNTRSCLLLLDNIWNKIRLRMIMGLFPCTGSMKAISHLTKCSRSNVIHRSDGISNHQPHNCLLNCGVCASGKLALADISTWNTSGPSSAGRAVVPPQDVVGSRGCKIRALDFFPIALRLNRHRGSSSAELPVRFRGNTINIHTWSRGSRDSRDLAVGFLAAQLRGALNNL